MKNLRLEEKLVEAFKISLGRCRLEDLAIYADSIILTIENYNDNTKKHKFLVETYKNTSKIVFATFNCEIMSNVYYELKKLSENRYEILNKELEDSYMFKIDEIIGANEHIWSNSKAIEE